MHKDGQKALFMVGYACLSTWIFWPLAEKAPDRARSWAKGRVRSWAEVC